MHSDHAVFMCSLIYLTTIPNVLSVTLIGPYHFCDHGFVDGIEELANKQNLLFNTKYQGIDRNWTKILFTREKGTFIWGEHSWGVTNAWDHPYVTSQTTPTPLPNNASMSKQPPKTPAKSANTTKTLQLPQITGQAVSEPFLCVIGKQTSTQQPAFF